MKRARTACFVIDSILIWIDSFDSFPDKLKNLDLPSIKIKIIRFRICHSSTSFHRNRSICSTEQHTAMPSTEDQTNSTTQQDECDDEKDESVRLKDMTTSCGQGSADSPQRPPSWLREDCFEFYQNKLLFSNSSSTPAIPVKDRVRLLRLAIGRAMGLKKRFPEALFLEFGVHEGKDLVRMAKFLSRLEEQDKSKIGNTRTIFHGFDSFEGLPEDWINGQVGCDQQPVHKKGAFGTGGETPDIANLDLNLGEHRHGPGREPSSVVVGHPVAFHKGWFHESLPVFLNEHPGTPVAFVHADADLYASTLTFLTLLCQQKLFCKGSVIVFDEFWNYPHWQDGEFKAWNEIVERFQLEYQYFGYHAPHPNAKKFKQFGYQSVAVVITKDME